ncbi:hypothetical protein [Amycolatopsis sp. H20-H5]|uniref:hypothetical protein n=1 Tax=Amycolatopsis sp. H20-H5 TaxID=3046309 RepID=UPI002DBF237D|nr:hypothetical protein [Amycolatopsis sp. H20-H5]MEC3976589.1 hypothetical protein [Amycolatopsis sp. H20-H5]
MTEAKDNGRRGRRGDTSADHLQRLRANKAKLDADKVEREQREEAAMAKLAESWSRIESLENDGEKRVAELQAQIKQVRAESVVRVERIRAEQAAALVELHKAGRTADEVAVLAELPKDRVRRILRSAAKSDSSSEQVVGEKRPPAPAVEPPERNNGRTTVEEASAGLLPVPGRVGR